MTMAQISLYMKAVSKSHRRDLTEAVITQMAGARYDEKSLKRLLKDLED